MARRPIVRMEEGSEPMFTSLLDLVLLLITFFVITINFVQTDQLNESVQLPPAQSAMPMERNEDAVYLNMDREGKLLGKDKRLDSLEKLKLELQRQRDRREEGFRQQKKAGEFEVVLVLRADKDCRYKDIWNALETCSAAGYRKWTLRVTQKPS